MSHPTPTLTKKQELAASLLARGETVSYAARAVNVSRETVSRWKQLTEFNDEVESIAAEARDVARREWEQLFNATVHALTAELSHGQHRAQVALSLLRLFGPPALPPVTDLPSHPATLPISHTIPIA